MARYIDADALIREFSGGEELKSISESIADERFIMAINNVPTADVAEVKHGEWEVCSDEYEICASEFVCSVCKESFCSSELSDAEFILMMKYCPNCGAKMFKLTESECKKKTFGKW